MNLIQQNTAAGKNIELYNYKDIHTFTENN